MDNCKDVLKRHKIGIILSSVSGALTILCAIIFNIFRSSFEASMATNQVSDSIIEYSLLQQLMYNNLGLKIVVSFGMFWVILFLIPMFKSLGRSNN